MTVGLICWRCEEPGHGYADCQRPWPATRQELTRRIARHVERWQTGLITLTDKRQFITAENRDYQKARNAA